ncbi:MAG: nitroreductase family protein [Planctomycetota bacterium]
MSARRSIRRYQPDPLGETQIERLLTAACWAPSAHNRQPWRFAVLRTSAAKERLAVAMGQRLAYDRRSDGDQAHVIAEDVNRSHARITGASVIIVVCTTLTEMDRYPDEVRRAAEYTMAVQSTAMAVQNLLLAAAADGLGACWMCAPLFCPDTVSSALALPSDWAPQALVTLGVPAGAGKPAVRKPLTDVVLTIE